MTTCDECGAGLTDADKNAAGHFRDRCQDCLEPAPDYEPHVTTCERDDCLVCADYHAERSTD